MHGVNTNPRARRFGLVASLAAPVRAGVACCIAAFVPGGLLPVAAHAQERVVDTDVAVPMRDGVLLRADVLRPATGGPFPVLVYRTPYGKHRARPDEATFDRAVERGYAVVIQDVRGRYRSQGEFRPYENEARDGYDTIEWAARQPWSDGSIGTFGLSYPGAVQWLAAVQTPPHLKAMVPAMTFSSAQNFFFAGGTWDMSWIDWIWFNIAPSATCLDPGRRTPLQPPGRRKVRACSASCRWPNCRNCERAPPITTTGCLTRRPIRGGTGRNCATSTRATLPRS